MLPKAIETAIEGEKPKLVIKTKQGKLCPYFFADTPLSKRLSGLTQIMHDLAQAKELMSLVTQVKDDEIGYSLWMAAIVTYGKCFASAKGRRIKLENEHVQRFNWDALNYHNDLIALRNEYFAHAGNNDYESALVGIILSPEDEGREVLWANHVMVKKNSISPEEVNSFCTLCDGLFGVVESIAEEVHSKVLDEYKEKDIDDLYERARNRT